MVEKSVDSPMVTKKRLEKAIKTRDAMLYRNAVNKVCFFRLLERTYLKGHESAESVLANLTSPFIDVFISSLTRIIIYYGYY